VIRAFLLLLLSATFAFLPACAYKQEEVSFRSADVELSGTLYLPAGKGPHPGIAFLHGSGPDSREQYRFYGELFAKRGIAALVYDKRGVGTSTGDWTRSPFAALADDAASAVAFLRKHEAIDDDRVGLWGGSEGAIVAPWVASRGPGVAFLILQSATGVTFAEQNLHQTEVQMRQLRLPASEVNEALHFQRLKHHYARTGDGWAEYAEALRRSRTEPWSSLGGPAEPDDWWWRWYGTKMDVDPVEIIKKVRAPVFAVWGERDHLIPVRKSRDSLARALTQGGNRDVTLLVVSGADHSLNKPGGPNPAPEYLDAMLAWLGKRAGLS
jgi:dipeptidyl aminopeptidase/acylaminoacyl peptidase